MVALTGGLPARLRGGVQHTPSSPTVTKATASANASMFDGMETSIQGLNSTRNLVYPEDVDSDAQQGHYICFWVRVIDEAKLGAFKKAKNVVNDSEVPQFDSPNPNIGPTSTAVAAAKKTLEESDKSTNSIFLKSRPTKRLPAAISLYMPPSVQVSYNAKYGEQEIGFLAEGGYEAIKAFQAGKTGDATMKALNALELGATQAILKTLDVVAPGGSALFAMDRGKIITPKMELMFEGIGRRQFSFSFVFIPKSAKEARTIQEIVKTFKYHMAANYAGGGANGLREMTFPDQFDIEYMYLTSRNKNLNKIATCALTKMDVEYGGDRYVAYDGGVPQTTKLSLNFTEFEIITRDHIADGY